jgi:hypothetical protein
MTLPSHPRGTYVALYGSHGAGWRLRAKALLDAAHVPWHDPSDARWEGITHENGDANQGVIDGLVAEEQDALLGAGCVVFHFAGNQPSLAARFELGVLAGRGVRTFVHVEPDAQGRNYLWAAVKCYRPHLEPCDSLEEAVRRAIERMEGAPRR